MEGVILLIEKISHVWLRFMVSSSFQLTIFLSIIGIIAIIFRKRSAKFLYLLWLVGLFRVFLPPNFNFIPYHPAVNVARQDFIPTIQIPEFTFTATREQSFQLSAQGYLFLFWLIGMGIFGLYWLWNYVRFRRTIRTEVRQFTLPANLKKLATDYRVQILTGPFIATPFVRGMFRPKIYLPQGASNWLERELKAILYHELAHIQGKDLILIVVQNIVQMVYFFHPLVWLANMQIFRYREKTRDDLAIEKMGGDALAYGKYLLTSMDNALEWQPMYSTSHYFLQSKSFLYQRFEYILNRKEKIMNRLTNLQKGVLVGCLMLALALSAFQSDIRSQTEFKDTYQLVSNSDLARQSKQQVKKIVVEGREIVFEAFDEAPRPVGGFADIQKNLIYPESARKAGIEGKVVVYAKIGADGALLDTFVGKSLIQDSSCEAAALEAIKKVKWQPAIKDGKPISVWVTVPVKFRLSKEGKGTTSELQKTEQKLQQIEENLKKQEKLLLEKEDKEAAEELQKTREELIKIQEKLKKETEELKKIDEKMLREKKEKMKILGAPGKKGPSVLKSDEEYIFVPYDEPPQPEGGFAAIQRHLRYPESARKNKIEGTVILYVKISAEGEVEKVHVQKSLADDSCNQAAIDAVKSVKWKPAKQRDKLVAVWVSVPVKFKLK